MVRPSRPIAAVGRSLRPELRRGRSETLAKDDVHDLLRRAITIFERDFLGQDFDPLDGLCRNVAKFTNAGNALAFEEQDRGFATASLGASDLRRERVEQLADAGRPGRPDIARIEDVLRRDIARDRTAQPPAGDDDRLALVELVGRGRIARGRGRWRGWRRLLGMSGGGHEGGACSGGKH